MAYSEFTLESAVKHLGVLTSEAELFPSLAEVSSPSWLMDTLARGTRLALISEKARSEFIVVPILLAARELCLDKLSIFSGQRLDVDPQSGLVGECDFLLTLGPAVPPLIAPIMAVVEAKKNDIEAGLGQCIAQMFAARRFNNGNVEAKMPMYGCVTTGEAWQFLRLSASEVCLDTRRIYIDDVNKVLATLVAIVNEVSHADG